MDRLVKTKIEDLVKTLQEGVSDYERKLYEIEDDGYMHSEEWFYYKGMIEACNNAAKRLTELLIEE